MKKRIGVVEDTGDNRRIIRDLLTSSDSQPKLSNKPEVRTYRKSSFVRCTASIRHSPLGDELAPVITGGYGSSPFVSAEAGLQNYRAGRARRTPKHTPKQPGAIPWPASSIPRYSFGPCLSGS
jgi:hypothetical protein